MGAQIPMRWENTSQQWWFATPVDWAAANGQFEVVRELLRLDGNVLIKLTSLRRIRRFESVWEDEGRFADAAKGRGRVAKELLGECETRNGNILIEAGYGGWLLYTAAAAGDGELVRYLLKREPLLVLGQGEYGLSEMLYAAARSKDCEIFKDVLGLANDIKFLVHNQDKDATAYAPSLSFQMMNRALHAAARGGGTQIIKELIRHCLDLTSYRDNQGSTVLHSAACRGQLEVAEELLSACPRLIASKDSQGNTALHIAAYRGHPALVANFLQNLPSLIMAVNNEGNTALHLAVLGFRASGFRSFDKQLEVVRHLISDQTADPPKLINCKNKEGKTAMHLAVLGKVIHGNLVGLLMTVPGLDINACDQNNMTAVDILELNLISGITSESLLKQMVSAGGKSMRYRDSKTIDQVHNYQNAERFCRAENSPGTSFRSVDSDTDAGMPFQDVSDKTKAVEAMLEISSRRLSAYAMFDMQEKAEYLGTGINPIQKNHTLSQNAKRRLATLLGWSGYNPRHIITPLQEPTNNNEQNCKKLHKDGGSSDGRPAKDPMCHRAAVPDCELSLRQKYSKQNKKLRTDSDLRKLAYRSAKNKIPKLCGNDMDPVISPALSSLASPSKSIAHSPIHSPQSLSKRFKGPPLPDNGNGSMSFSCNNAPPVRV